MMIYGGFHSAPYATQTKMEGREWYWFTRDMAQRHHSNNCKSRDTIDLSQWNAVYMTSCLGCLRKSAGANSPLSLYGNMAYVQMDAALCTEEILSCLDTDPEFQHRPFQQW